MHIMIKKSVKGILRARYQVRHKKVKKNKETFKFTSVVYLYI